MDPALWELYLEGARGDEVMALFRLRDESATPAGVRIVTRFGRIATGRLAREDILRVRALPEVVSMKAPDPLIADDAIDEEPFEDLPLAASDVRRPASLAESGRGVVIGIIDWGLDVAYPSFRNRDGSTRLLALWDQQRAYDPAAANRFGYGRIHQRAEIDHALAAADPYAVLAYDPLSFDSSRNGTHATHVCDIAAGNGAAGGPHGIAPAADLVFVHLSALHGGFRNIGDSVTLLEAIDFVSECAAGRPWVINLSMGNMGGPHDGTTLVEQGFDAALLAAPGRAIAQSCGNYFARRAHAARQLLPGEVTTLQWVTDPGDTTPNELEIWYSARDRFSVRLIAPNGTASPAVHLGEMQPLELAGVRVARIYHRAVDPNNFDNHINIFLYTAAPSGTWRVEVTADDVVDGRFQAWIERDEGCGRCQSRFAADDVTLYTTTNTICNGFRTVTVGAYDGHVPLFTPAPFSSMGPTRDGRQKPDVAAPGVRVVAARSHAEGAAAGAPLLTRKSGTSMAAPHVTGTIALMFEAAARPLSIVETRRLLVATAAAAPPELRPRAGGGRLNVEAAVAAARVAAHKPESTEEETLMQTIPETKENACCSDCATRRGLDAPETIVAQLGFSGGAVVAVDPASAAADYSTATLDDAMMFTLSRPTGNWVVTGNPLTGTTFEVSQFAISVPLPSPLPSVVDVDATNVAAIVIDEVVFMPSSMTAATRRWLRMPRLREFYALSGRDQTSQRDAWITAILRAAALIGVAGVTVNRTWLQGRSMPALRILVAQFAATAIPVHNIDQPARNFRGARVDGVTSPLFRFPLSEPECYLPVIAGAEGKMEAINANDLGAGISLGPIQFNVQHGLLMNFLRLLADLDPSLFADELTTPLGWTLTADGDHFDLTIAGTPPVVVHGDAAHQQDLIGFLQSSTPGRAAFADIDAAFRRSLAARFRNIVVWPHVQEMMLNVIADFLRPALATMSDPANNIPALDPANPDHDLFVLKALLLSAKVRFDSALAGLLTELQPFPTVAEKLRHLMDAIPHLRLGASRIATLTARLTAQRRAAERFFNVIRRLRGETVTESESDPERESELEGEAAPRIVEPAGPPDLPDDYTIEGASDDPTPPMQRWGDRFAWHADEAVVDGAADAVQMIEAALTRAGATTPQSWSPAALFDTFAANSEGEAFGGFAQVVARPRESLPPLQPGDIVIHRALGEGSLARLSVVANGETEQDEARRGVYTQVIEPARSIGEQFVRRIADASGRVPADQIVLRIAAPELTEDVQAIPCGAGSTLSLHTVISNAVDETRRLSGEPLPLVPSPCNATTHCPTPYQSPHTTGDATHFGSLDLSGSRIVDLAGLMGVDLTSVRGGAAKASTPAIDVSPYAPLADLSYVAIRDRTHRETHIHRGGTRTVESRVDGDVWKNLAVEHALNLLYTLMKRRWFERSVHRQWGKEETIEWIGNLCRFYKDQTGLRLGIGDISHVVGETISDHHSHQRGVDVDLYVVDYPAGTPFPEAYFCSGASGTLSLSTMVPPASSSGSYGNAAAALPATQATAVWQRYATVLAFCFATWNRVNAFVWHGARQIDAAALTIAQNAMANWNTYWGPAPTALPQQRSGKELGEGNSNYGAGKPWPLHHDHIHVRLN
jgi:hypothetical protein